ncbi:MAG: molybdopterin molybdenumtransferase MoeA [Proteobacteria bacterium]|jgi:molybdopterin molybdotransferase|nr:molybdopterin molybdenumtransferase MoeA [Pseudomonadota bacterium]
MLIPVDQTAGCGSAESSEGIRSVSQARQDILAAIRPVTATEKLALRAALDRVLAEAITSPLDVPGHTNSAMDGYAVASSQLAADGTTTLSVIGTAYAGRPLATQPGAGECIRIMTGAPMPPGTDTVIMQEQVTLLDEQRITIGTGHCPGQNVRQAGEDIPRGSQVLASGHTLRAADLGLLASLGIAEINVRRRPRVAFFSTGDELRSIGETLGEGDIYDSNRYSLYGMLRRLNMDIIDMGVVRDDPVALREAFRDATRQADVVVTSGGVSVGEADYIKPVLDEIGEINFWKIAMKPGRPLTFGNLGDTLFFGLPGNPVAVMVSFYQFVQPALQYLASGRQDPPLCFNARCTEPLRKRPGRTEYLRGILEPDQAGDWQVRIAGRQGSGILSSMSRANCFIVLAEDDGDVHPGDPVRVQPFAGLI